MQEAKGFEREYSRLNKAQKMAVDAIEGPVLVVAGPGSGKTQILSLRVANILKKTDTRPSNILCLTFTDSAAINMRKRLETVIGRDAYRVAIFTFHSFCTSVIERFPEYFYGGASFSPADQLVQIEVLEAIFKEADYLNPLRSEHPEKGFVYAYDVRSAIGHLKKAGLSPDEFEKILDHNDASFEYANSVLSEVFSDRISIKQIGALEAVAAELKEHKVVKFPSKYFKALIPAIAESLALAITKAKENGSTKPLSSWKEKYTAKDPNGKRILKDGGDRSGKMRALAGFYREYSKRMFERGYYDFDDMLLDVIHALQEQKTLLYELQEQYQYLLVDEFQDTNDAQMQLLRLMANAAVNEGRPNLMVVGDDDQAIYKFQGALVSNILDFKREFKDPVIVTMADNYRSTQNILDVAQFVIRKGEERLENLIPGLEKKLVAANHDLGKGGAIIEKILPSSPHEYYFIAEEIKNLIKQGIAPNHIAVIGRKHEHLENIVPYLYKAGVPVHYERQQNVLHEPHVHELIQIARYIVTLARKDTKAADYLLPEILSYSFWGIERKIVWEISLQADKTSSSWLEVMQNSEHAHIRKIAEFVLDIAVRSLHEPLEYIVDKIVGAHVHTLTEMDDEDGSPQLHAGAGTFISPFKEYYFSREKFESNKTEYLTFLSSLRVFMQALREYKHGKPLKVEDLVTFVDMHEKNNILVTDNSPFITAQNSVELLTAHKAKGLEFEYVFVIHCQNDIWAGRGIPSKLPFPANLPIAPAGDTSDDQLRLFYVALTRAKKHLYITSHEISDNGKDALRLQFLSAEEGGTGRPEALRETRSGETPGEALPDIHDILMDSWRTYHKPPATIDEQALLTLMLQDYQMSVTHLNNFLDVSKGGPQAFLEQNLLRFPQAKTVSGAYGSAMHKAVEMLYVHLRRTGDLPKTKELVGWFEAELARQRLSDDDFRVERERGEICLKIFYAKKKKSFKADDRIEVNFKHQGVVVEGASLTGKIDKVVTLPGQEICVHDFKTGNALMSWEGGTAYEKIKLHNYRRQLVFYKLLVEHSRDFSAYKVRQGIIEFLEPLNDEIVDLPLVLEDALVERTIKLISAVSNKIKALDFPDTSKYPETLEGILEFEDELLRFFVEE